MSILKNAIDSIVIGLEDYQSPDQRRIVSSTRNILAGILLLFKYKLSELSPSESNESLIKQRVMPEIDAAGDVRWIGKGRKTVDVQIIKERFESLDISVDWKRLDQINSYRNDIEHYFSTENLKSAQRLISNSFLIIRDFISNHLNEDPKHLLGEDAWTVLIKVNEVYEKEKAECEEAIESLKYFSNQVMAALSEHSCNECGSELIMPSERNTEATNVEFTCKSCENILPYEDIVKLAFADYFGRAAYFSGPTLCFSGIDGGDSPIADCPECHGIYLYDEGICSSCGYHAEHDCQRCGSNIPPEELLAKPFCSYCAHMMSKND